MDVTEQQMVAAAVGGDEDSLTALLRRYGSNVRAHVASAIDAKWRSVLDTDDVMQVTYLEAFLRIGQFEYRGDGSFVGWLSRIAINNLRDSIEQLERLKRLPPDKRVGAGDDAALMLLDHLGWTTTTPSASAARHEVQEGVAGAVARLPEDYAAVVRLYDLEGRTIEDVAATLGRSVGAVYMLRARALDRLRQQFAEDRRFVSKSA